MKKTSDEAKVQVLMKKLTETLIQLDDAKKKTSTKYWEERIAVKINNKIRK